jgi:hypothetical protein
VWCRDCRHTAELDPDELVARYGPETSIPDWAAKLVCWRCGGHAVDVVLTGARRQVRGRRSVECERARGEEQHAHPRWF